ncbi:MAG: hypothetical protein JSV44_05140 [Candidatus Zixiibacteriota bacterium]|nr:MAG: hypothetical protein JSV44_05140 [candidate division Zixibacteria bacterium]
MYILVFLLTLVSVVAAQDAGIVDTVNSAPGITIETAVDRSEIYIGDLIRYRLAIIHDSDIILTPPPVGANLGGFDVKDYQTDEVTRLKNGQIKTESRFVLSTFTTGDYIIPPIPIEFFTADSVRKILISEPVPIKVKSLLAEGVDTADIRDIKGPVSFERGMPIWFYIVAGVVLAGLILAYIIWRRRRRKKGEEFIDTRKPWEIACEDLALLEQKNLPAAGEFKQYYVQLTEIVRAFLGRVYKIPVLDMTTEEFCVCIIDEEIGEELYSRFKAFLSHADLVKFAKLIPETERVVADFDEARDIIESVRQQEMAREEAAHAGAAIAGAGGTGV